MALTLHFFAMTIALTSTESQCRGSFDRASLKLSRASVQSFSIFPFQQNEHDWMWLAAFFIHAPAITIFLESCLVLLNHPHRTARNNSLEPRRKPSKTFSRTSWYVWYECNLKQQIECNSCSLLQFLRCFTFPHTHMLCYPGPACHEGVCTSSLLVSVDAPGCQPSAACSKKSQHGLKRKHYFMEKQKMIKKYVSSAGLGTTHLAIRSENTAKTDMTDGCSWCSWVWNSNATKVPFFRSQTVRKSPWTVPVARSGHPHQLSLKRTSFSPCAKSLPRFWMWGRTMQTSEICQCPEMSKKNATVIATQCWCSKKTIYNTPKSVGM